MISLRSYLLRIAVSVALLLAPAAARAATTFTWSAVNGGTFSLAGSWTPSGGPPVSADTAQFNALATYTVNFANSATNSIFTQAQGTVTLAIGSNNVYSALAGFTVGNTLGQTANLTVNSGTLLVPNATSSFIGFAGASGSGALTVTGTGSYFTAFNSVHVGYFGAGSLSAVNGGSASIGGNAYLGANSTDTGSVVVTTGGTLVANALFVGDGGAGILSVTANGSATVGYLVLGNGLSSSGSVSVGNGVGIATLSVNGISPSIIGAAGTGTLNVNAGGTLTNTGAVVIAKNNGSHGTANVYAGGTWNQSGGSIFVGGDGVLGGTAGLTVNSGGTLTVTGTGNGITTYSGHGSLTLNGGTINSPNLTLGDSPSLVAGTLNVTGGALNAAGATLHVAGSAGAVSVNLLNGATAAAGDLEIGNAAASSTVTVQSGSTLTTSGMSRIGIDGSANATLTVTGTNSVWNNSNNPVEVGFVYSTAGNGTLNVQSGGHVNTGNQDIKLGAWAGATGTTNVQGSLTVLNAGTGTVSVGDTGNGAGVLNVTAGGTVLSGTGAISRMTGATGTATVAGGAWTVTNTLAVGGDTGASGGTGTLTLGTGAAVSTANLMLWPGGTVNLTNGTLALATLTDNGGAMNFTAGTLRFTGNAAVTRTLNLNFGSLEATSGATLSLNGATVTGGFLRGTGTFAVTGNATLSGVTTFNSTIVSVTGVGSFTNFSNSGTLAVAAGLATPTVFNGFINQGSGSIAVGAASPLNVADFQTYGTLTINPATITQNFSQTTLMTNTGTSPLYFNGGSRTFVGTPGTAVFPSNWPDVSLRGTPTFVAGVDLNGKNAVVAGGLFVNNGYVEDSSNNFAGTATVVADFGSLVKGAGFFQNTVLTQNGGKFQAGNSPGAASFGKFVLGPGGVSSYVFAIDDATGTAGPTPDTAGHVSGWGLVRTVAHASGSDYSGDFVWTATAADKLLVSLETLLNPTTVGVDVPGMMDHFDPSHSYVWPAVEWTGSYAGPADAATLDSSTAFDLSGFANPVTGRFGWALDESGQTLSLTYTPTAVPEPGTLGLLAAAALGLTVRYRRAFGSADRRGTLRVDS